MTAATGQFYMPPKTSPPPLAQLDEAATVWTGGHRRSVGGGRSELTVDQSVFHCFTLCHTARTVQERGKPLNSQDSAILSTQSRESVSHAGCLLLPGNGFPEAAIP